MLSVESLLNSNSSRWVSVRLEILQRDNRLVGMPYGRKSIEKMIGYSLMHEQKC